MRPACLLPRCCCLQACVSALLLLVAVHTQETNDELELVPETSLDLDSFTADELQHTFGVAHENDVPAHELVYPAVERNGSRLQSVTVELAGRRVTLPLAASHHSLFHPQLLSVDRHWNGTHRLRVGQLPDACHYETVTQHTLAAISDCDDILRGVIISEGELYVLHGLPARHARRQRRSVGLHVIYKRGLSAQNGTSATEVDRSKREFCGSDVDTLTDVRLDMIDLGIGDATEDLAVIANRLTATSDLVVELAIFVDQKLWERFSSKHGSGAEAKLNNYIATVINSIQIIYKQPTMMPQLKYRITNLQILRQQPWQIADNRHNTGNAQQYLAAFCKYQNSLANKNWDHAFLLSGYDLHRGYGSTTISGIARLNGMCDSWNTCTVTEGFDFTSVFIGAHELGHSLGMSHDEPYCSSKYIMSASLGAGKTTWSSCSMRDFHKQIKYLDNRGRNCLRDSIHAEVLNTNLNSMPGQIYSADTQCAMMHGTGYKMVRPRNDHYDTLCYMMWCGTGAWGRIISSHPALEGTTCRHGQWCVQGRCVPYSHSSAHGATPDPLLTERVDGGWSAWSSVQCSRCQCGPLTGSIGLLRSTRVCNNPAPRNGGRSCGDDKVMAVVCSGNCQSTQGIQAYMDDICLNHRTTKRDFEISGKATRFLNQRNRACKVFCKQVSVSSSTSVSYRFYGDQLPDGTPCGRGNDQSYCVDGECLPLSCNDKALSTRSQGCPRNTCSFDNPITISVPVEWSSWSAWSYCSVTCGQGRKRRARTCPDPGNCDGDNEDSEACNAGACSSSRAAEWSSWYAWTSCSVTCGMGTRTRDRRCDNGDSCRGTKSERQSCDQGWCPWSDWSQCSRSCGKGTQRRSRQCSGSRLCSGSYYDDQACNERTCNSVKPVGTADWNSWSTWSSCSVSCGGKGLRQRSRQCSGQACAQAHDQQSESCGQGYCPWSDWSSCSASCGATGTRKRTRQCPYGNCVDEDGTGHTLSQTDSCYNGACSSSEWQDWGRWTSCSTTCGNGVRARYRSCRRGASHEDCEGESSERDECHTGVSCGSWNEWAEWSPCSVTCMQGTKTRKRTCSGPSSQCLGISTQLMTCHQGSCLSKGQWSTWSQWNECSRSCGTGIKSRQRTCSEIKGSCDGNSLESVPCNTFGCDGAVKWLDWGPWSVCSRTCGGGQRQRFRKCTPSGACSSTRELETCDTMACGGGDLPSSWGTWSVWSSCSQACGSGIQKRRRSCNGNSCGGTRSEKRDCYVRACAEWGGWGHWSSCSHTCNHGTRRRIRNCYGWGDCQGDDEQNEACLTRFCS